MKGLMKMVIGWIKCWFGYHDQNAKYNINTPGIEPELESFLSEILDQMQIKANADETEL